MEFIIFFWFVIRSAPSIDERSEDSGFGSMSVGSSSVRSNSPEVRCKFKRFGFRSGFGLLCIICVNCDYCWIDVGVFKVWFHQIGLENFLDLAFFFNLLCSQLFINGSKIANSVWEYIFFLSHWLLSLENFSDSSFFKISHWTLLGQRFKNEADASGKRDFYAQKSKICGKFTPWLSLWFLFVFLRFEKIQMIEKVIEIIFLKFFKYNE